MLRNTYDESEITFTDSIDPQAFYSVYDRLRDRTGYLDPVTGMVVWHQGQLQSPDSPGAAGRDSDGDLGEDAETGTAEAAERADAPTASDASQALADDEVSSVTSGPRLPLVSSAGSGPGGEMSAGADVGETQPHGVRDTADLEFDEADSEQQSPQRSDASGVFEEGSEGDSDESELSSGWTVAGGPSRAESWELLFEAESDRSDLHGSDFSLSDGSESGDIEGPDTAFYGACRRTGCSAEVCTG